MTPDERNLLTRFLGDLNGVKGVQKDPDASNLISQAVNANPDAPYLLVQHAIIADQALAAAQARIAELEAEVQRQFAQGQQGQDRGLLGGLFGQRPAAAPPPQPRQGPWGGPQPYLVVPQTQPQQGGFFGGGAPAQPGGMGSFLQNAGATAAGVAGGAFLFQGLSNLFGGHQGSGFLGGGYGQPGEVINNYYGDGDQGGGMGGGGYDSGSPDAGYDSGGYDSGGGYDSANGDPTGDDYS